MTEASLQKLLDLSSTGIRMLDLQDRFSLDIDSDLEQFDMNPFELVLVADELLPYTELTDQATNDHRCSIMDIYIAEHPQLGRIVVDTFNSFIFVRADRLDDLCIFVGSQLLSMKRA